MERIKSKSLLLVTVLVMSVMCCLVGCMSNNEGGNITPQHDSSKWFTEAELSKLGLVNLPTPTGLTGEMSTSDSWFNNGISFFQPCPSVEVMKQNADMYFNYLKQNYAGCFGKAEFDGKFSVDENIQWYKIVGKENLDDYFSDNPSKLYKFYYVTDIAVGQDGYLVKGSVYSLEIRYEMNADYEYGLKLFVESADTTHNKAYTLLYRLA